MAEPKVILAVEKLQVSFDKNTIPLKAVYDVSFKLKQNNTLAIVGESGSGKSLTALALMALLPENAQVNGNIKFTVDDKEYALDRLTDNSTWSHLRGKEIGMVFQEPMSSLNPVMKIGNQLTEAIATHRKIPHKQAKAIAVEWLGKVRLPQPGKIFNRYPHQLSGGQKQRVMIAIAMCNSPILLIADEPTTALDTTVQKEILKLMHELQLQSQTAMIFITHDLELAATIADEVMVMYKGTVVEYGNTSQVLQTPRHAYTKALIDCKPSPQHKGRRLPVISDFLEPKQTEQVQNTAYDIPHTIAEPLLQVNHLRVWFTGQQNWFGKPMSYFKAVDDVSFTLNKGEVLGLVGESGCGKSTLSRSLIGLLPVYDGQIIFDDIDVSKFPPAAWRGIRRNIQMIFQDPYASLNPRMSIGDILMEPMKVHGVVPNGALRKEAFRLLDMVHLPKDSFTRHPHQFSGGQRQRIGIARALALRPQLIICDESVSALDVSVQAQILNLLKELQGELELSYLFISHDLSVVHYISDRVMVMQAGKIVEAGDATQVLKQPHHNYTKQLIDSMPISGQR